jgi:hypothetical protein
MIVLRAAMVVLLASCTAPSSGALPDGDSPPLEPPTADQAEELFGRLVLLARAGDFNGLCELGAGSCEAILEMAGRNVPSADPSIVVNQTMTEARGAAESDTARLLVVCGVADSGESYVTEIAVMWNGTELMAGEPIYWSGLQVSTSGTGHDESEAPEMTTPPGCPGS